MMISVPKICASILLMLLVKFDSIACDKTELKYAIDPGFEYSISDDNSGPGEPLFLTPLIEKGRISEARKKAAVKPFLKDIESYAGYLTVNKNYNSNLFFWFFKADDRNWENLPVAVWLQGGPGGSSLLALFIENGPYVLVDKTLHKRVHSWHKKCNMIFIDNPVGSGFSFTDSNDGYARNQTVIGEELYSAIKQFFTLFPNLVKNDFYITGESYAGKYIPAFAYTIYKNNALMTSSAASSNTGSQVFVNLKGLFIGDGLVDPVNMLKFGDYLYQLGLIDTNTMKQFHSYEKRIRQMVRTKNWSKATSLFGEMVLQYIYFPNGSLFNNVTGFHEHYNFYNLNPPDWNSHHTDFVNSDLFRRSVHIGNRPFSDGKQTAVALQDDIMKSVIKEVEELLNHYRIVFYNGQLDIICAYPLTINFIKNMKWSSAQEYAKAKRHIWRVGKDIAGYYKSAGNLTEVLVRNAGHMVPSDQPLWAHVLFNNFIFSKDFNDEL